MSYMRSACYAGQVGDLDRLAKLIAKDRNVVHFDGLEKGSSGYTPLHYAARSGHKAACILLLQSGAEVNKATLAGKSTPLHRAAFMGHTPIVKLLLEHGASPQLQDSDGATALHKAAEQGHLECCKALIETDPSLADIVDKHGRRADSI